MLKNLSCNTVKLANFKELKNTYSMRNKISDTLLCIGRNVKKYRNIKNITQQELAFYCENMDRSTISNIERFNCDGLNITTIVRICFVLDIDVSQLFEKEKSP